MTQASTVWPPPSTDQTPTYEFSLSKAMIRSQPLGIRFYLPSFWERKMEISVHGMSGLYSKPAISCLPWSEIESVTLACRRNQVCIAYGYTTFGFKAKVAQIFTLNQESFDSLGVVLKRFARCPVVEDGTIYWSYSKLIFWFSLFWLCESFNVTTHHLGQWVGFWRHILVLLNHLVSVNLP